MDSGYGKPTPSEAHPETMDFLSTAWCNFAIQALHTDEQNKSIVLLDNAMKKLDLDGTNAPSSRMDRRVDDGDFKSIPPWKSNDVQSWIRMQQAMHPELNYNSYLRKNLFSWKIAPFKLSTIRKWFKDMKSKRKEETRLQRAELHAAISVAAVAAALAATAADTSTNSQSSMAKESAVASAAALVAAQCAQVAEAMGAKREHLTAAIGSAMTSTSTSDILTLTTAAATALKGAATLKTRCNNRLTGSEPVLPIDQKMTDDDFDFKKWRSILASGAELHVETPDGNFRVRSVSISLNNGGKVILQLRKFNLLRSKKESLVLDMHVELYKDDEDDKESYDTCYLIVLTTKQGLIKLDMGDDYHRYKAWATTINHMLTFSAVPVPELQLCKI